MKVFSPSKFVHWNVISDMIQWQDYDEIQASGVILVPLLRIPICPPHMRMQKGGTVSEKEGSQDIANTLSWIF